MKTRLPSFLGSVRWVRLLAVLLLFAAGRARALDYKYTQLHKFAGTDGAGPEATLIEAADGKFYGTTYGDFSKTATTANAAINGTVFRIGPGGALTTLHVFSGTDGAHPGAPLVQLANGLLYGTTSGGFAGNGITVFRMATDGTGFTTLLKGAPKEGLTSATLVKGSDGNLYGTERQGGAVDYGAIFRITPAGAATILYSFKGHPDGEFPNGPLVQAANGDFYGCTGGGGVNDEGTIFRITPAGVYTQLHALAQFGVEGSGPQSLVQAGDGNFYGTAQQGGDENDPPTGTVFRVTPAGVFTVLVNLGSGFGTTGIKAVDPVSGLIVGPDGALYGTGKEGGYTGTGYGGVYRVSLTGVYSDLCGFDGVDGAYPFGGLLRASDGNFYGTTAGKVAETDDTTGGDQNGTVFRLAPKTVTPTPTPTPKPTPTPTPTPKGTPVVTVAATVPATAVNSEQPGVFTFNISAPQTVKTVIKYKLKGSAHNGTDYVGANGLPLDGKAKIKPGKTSVNVQVVAQGDLGGASSKKVKLVIDSAGEATVGTVGAVKIKLLPTQPTGKE